MLFVIVGGVVVMVVVAFIVSRGRYYRRMFSDENFREFYTGLLRAIESAKAAREDQEPNIDDGTAFITDAGLANIRKFILCRKHKTTKTLYFPQRSTDSSGCNSQ